MALLKNRQEAGEKLAEELSLYQNKKDTIILALPRGGVPVAFVISQALHLPLDVFLVRKLGTPGQEELAMGAIALGDVTVFNDEIIHSLYITGDQMESIIAKEKTELNRRNELYRQGKPPLDLKDKTVILVDDGIATGSTVMAAIKAIKKLGAKAIILAVPLSPVDTLQRLENQVDKIYCLEQPEPFYAIGMHYSDFPQTSDTEVIRYLTAS